MTKLQLCIAPIVLVGTMLAFNSCNSSTTVQSNPVAELKSEKPSSPPLRSIKVRKVIKLGDKTVNVYKDGTISKTAKFGFLIDGTNRYHKLSGNRFERLLHIAFKMSSKGKSDYNSIPHLVVYEYIGESVYKPLAYMDIYSLTSSSLGTEYPLNNVDISNDLNSSEIVPYIAVARVEYPLKHPLVVCVLNGDILTDRIELDNPIFKPSSVIYQSDSPPKAD